MEQLLKKAKLITILLLIISFQGCDEDDVVLPQVIADFTYTLNSTSGTVTFINTSEEANSYKWDFGNGETSTEINPIRTFATGTYTVSLEVRNLAGSTDTFQSEITVTIPEDVLLPIDFDGTNVAYGDIVGDNIGFSVVANPETGNGNDTNVGQMETGGGQFQNVQFPLGTAVDFSGDNKTIQLELFASIAIDVLVKFEDGAAGARDVEVLTTHTGSGWETLSFDFATNGVASFIQDDPQNGQALVPVGQYNGMVLFIGFNADPGVEGTFYVDNIAQTQDDGGGMATEPTTAAPAPTQDAADVTSVFSNVYTNVAGTNARAFGNDGGATFTEIQVVGDDVWSYANTNFVGLQNDTGFDGRTNFSMDIWVAEDISFRAGLISFTDPVSREDVEVNLTGGQWTNIDVALADLVPSLGSEGPLPDNPTINQIIFDVLGDGVEANIFVDNVIFYTDDGGGMATEPTTAAPAPTQDAADVTSVFSNVYTNVAGTNARAFGNDGGATFTEIQVVGDDVWSYANTNFVGLQNDTGFDGRTNFSMDIWVAEDISFRAGLISFTDPVSREDVEVNLTGGQWTNIDVALADLVPSLGSEGPLPDNPTINQIIFDVLGDGVEANIFVDNVIFYTADGGGSGGTKSPFCLTQVQAFGGDAGSDILLSVFNVDAQTMRIEIESADGDPVDTLVFPAGDWNPVPGISSAPAEVSPGVWAGEFFYGGGAPANVEFNILWSKVSFGGNWSLNAPGNLSMVPFDATCDTSGEGGTGGVAAFSSLPADFENGEEFSAVFESASVSGSITANPVSGGINTSANVYTFNKPAGTEFYGGMENVFASPLDLTTTRTFKVKVYSTKPNAVFQFELQRRPTDSGIPNYSLQQTVTNANEWVELTFDFGAVVPGSFDPNIYNTIVIIPDFDSGNDPTSTSETYYLDDLILE
ncbi:PKD domain-containing protein [Maribacter aestuarii]|uniref:PKD domain-containing protein n=1 Tax=Maribacter aestuarii TaxID=1130723 RepID=UPI00248B04D6|nr:PKD domain-containing protein [Maribacter aestuarii]